MLSNLQFNNNNNSSNNPLLNLKVWRFTIYIRCTTDINPKIAAPSGWVTFGGPVQQPQSIQVTQVPQQVPQVAQQVATPQVPNIDLDKIRAYIQQLENLLRDKDAEISYWKSMCEQAQQQQAELFHTANENSRRADELEMHLQNIMQEIQDDKHRRLSK